MRHARKVSLTKPLGNEVLVPPSTEKKTSINCRHVAKMMTRQRDRLLTHEETGGGGQGDRGRCTLHPRRGAGLLHALRRGGLRHHTDRGAPARRVSAPEAAACRAMTHAALLALLPSHREHLRPSTARAKSASWLGASHVPESLVSNMQTRVHTLGLQF